MNWDCFFGVIIIMVFIFIYEWPKLKHLPKRDQAAFFSLAAITGFLSLFDLPNTPGPVTLLETMFKPLGRFMEK